MEHGQSCQCNRDARKNSAHSRYYSQRRSTIKYFDQFQIQRRQGKNWNHCFGDTIILRGVRSASHHGGWNGAALFVQRRRVVSSITATRWCKRRRGEDVHHECGVGKIRRSRHGEIRFRSSRKNNVNHWRLTALRDTNQAQRSHKR